MPFTWIRPFFGYEESKAWSVFIYSCIVQVRIGRLAKVYQRDEKVTYFGAFGYFSQNNCTAGFDLFSGGTLAGRGAFSGRSLANSLELGFSREKQSGHRLFEPQEAK